MANGRATAIASARICVLMVFLVKGILPVFKCEAGVFVLGCPNRFTAEDLSSQGGGGADTDLSVA